MRNTRINTYQTIVSVCALLLSLTNGCVIQKTNAQPLVTENRECILKSYSHIPSEVLPLYVSIDLPVKGPQPLIVTDSIYI